MNTTQLIGIVAGILTATSMLPQLVKIIKHKKADDVSMFMLIVLLSGLATWIVYGILREDWPIIVTNCFSFIINVLMVIFRIKYSHKN
jgi:MtN3 and saliva related transmembrane protein